MKLGAWFTRSALVCAVALGAVGCGTPPDTKTAKVAAGDMPSGETWTGVYFHPVYGNLHMIEEGENVVARWRRANQSHCGEMSGTKNGNVFRFKWTEHTIGGVGPSADSRGKGYFVYKMGKEGTAELDGEFGLNNDETGSDWHNVKQLRVVPDMKTVNCDAAGIAAPGPGKGWE